MFLQRILCFLLVAVACSWSARVRHQSTGKQALKFLKGIGVNVKKSSSASAGLWPSVFNLATKAIISVNATCGEGGREEFCRLGTDGVKGRCGVCDNFSPDPAKRHPINYAIDDGTNRWWQSPALHYGPQYEYVTVTLDLKQVYQVAYVIIKVANSPRPGAWILERSTDGEVYKPWQYFATSDKDCLERYGVPARKGKPHYFTDTEVICTTFYSKLIPMENGEIHTFLIHGRPGANETSPELLQFTRARYVRLRFQGLRGKVEPLPAWLSQDLSREKRLFYSIRDISVGGQCVCNGHAASCRHNVASGHPECECSHHTWGPNCEKCSPLYNQRQWGPGTSRDARPCLPCNCNGHAKSCFYDVDVDRAGDSMDINGYYQGGGVCVNCSSHTTGINCEKCIAGYHRPPGTRPDSRTPCVKCECESPGSTGHCFVNDFKKVECECKAGYAGDRCRSCSPGYRGFPKCELCPCDLRGMVDGGDCEGECKCKANVIGKFCDHCKPGYYSLQEELEDGCLPCFCSGVTNLCEAARLSPKIVKSGDNWLITDISVGEFEVPTLNEYNMISAGNYEIPGVEAYYWLAPEAYLGNKLELYGSDLIIKLHWVVMRGDTSGKPTNGPNLIMVGSNGLRIAIGDDSFSTNNMTFRVKLAEYSGEWYHVPSDVKDIVTRLRRTEYKGKRVTREQFLGVLLDLKHLLIRGKFHTDQIEVALEEATITVDNFPGGYSSVEKCSCPSGYTGLSCESCHYGYVRIFSNTSSHTQKGVCVKCDCNGHSETCNPDTGECLCEHNTTGETCERCLPGFYGNPLLGGAGDCKKCACPLEEEENNFSPSCQLDSSSLSNEGDGENGYVCTQCPKGYTGDHCEICDDGYFGVPSQIGGKCEPCTCGGGPCDRITGQCLGCRGNTEGWRCERCKPGYFGNPTVGCEACLCDTIGSNTTTCHNITGQCDCKDRFVGRTCKECEVGYGNVSAGCLPCSCNLVGSKSNVCNPQSGLCDCHVGVEGFHCDACQHLHYGFSESGCQSCQCNLKGSEISTCDIITGQCRCKSHYIGRSCDRCEDTYWDSPIGCQECNCDLDGSISKNCNNITGNCKCKPGVGGSRCNKCIKNYYGFSQNGCKECDVCDKEGHICDQNTGRCVCPPNSHGATCNQCKPNSWGYESNIGCKLCNCSTSGSLRSQCNQLTGTCQCHQGYKGDKCDQCEHGYYGYPKCKRCSCNPAGTNWKEAKCDSTGICQCNENGVCPCKINVIGKRCNHCRDKTFGLHIDNAEGCTQCFCFGRSTICSDARMTWSKIRSRNRTLNIDFIDNLQNNINRITSNNVDINNFEEIEGVSGDVQRPHDHFNIPLYWRLPPDFNGDRILSYSGYLRFISETLGNSVVKNEQFKEAPLIILEGNSIKLYSEIQLNERNEVRLHETAWKCLHTEGNYVTRDLFMLALQNVSAIFIKATDYYNFEKVSLSSVSLDNALEVPGNPPPLTNSVEKCDCPRQFSGTSCQNPNEGFFRQKVTHPHIKSAVITSDIIDAVIGKSVKCQCNNRSTICQPETGGCLSCGENTSGKSCQICAEGFYGDPMKKGESCKACACPSPSQNFAISCSPNPRGNHFVCKCKEGYYGPTCDRCSPGFYGQPHLPGGKCAHCNCNKEGRINNECDQKTGLCNCKIGITGPKCSQCEQSRHVLENSKCTPCDGCIQILLDDFDAMSFNFGNQTQHVGEGLLQPPWESLDKYQDLYEKFNEQFTTFLDHTEKMDLLFQSERLDIYINDSKIINETLNEKGLHAKLNQDKAEENRKTADKLEKGLNDLRDKLKYLMAEIKNFGKSHISTKEALKKAQNLNSEILSKYNEVNSLPSSNKVMNNCGKIYEKVKKIFGDLPDFNAEKLYKDLIKTNDKITDLEAIVKQIKANNSNFNNKNDINEANYERIKAKMNDLNAKMHKVKKDLDERKEIIAKTWDYINKTEDNQLKLITEQESIKNLTERVEYVEGIMDKSIDTLEIYMEQIEDHVNDLDKNVSDFKEAFKLSTKELDAVKASRVFNQINDYIKEANATIKVAKDDFEVLTNTILEPPGTDSIYHKTFIATADSGRLVTRVELLMDSFPVFNERLSKLYSQIDDVKRKNWKNGIANNAQSEYINQLTPDNKSKNKAFKEIESIIKTAIEHSEKMRSVYKEAMNINITMQYGLMKDYQKYLNLTSTKRLEDLQKNVRVTQEILNNVTRNFNLDKVHDLKASFGINHNKSSGLQEKIALLKAKIKKAQQIAENIKVPISGDQCYRTYRIRSLQPSTITNISLTFMVSRSSGSLFYIANDQDQFINLNIVNKMIVLNWRFLDKKYTLKSPFNENQEVKVRIERVNRGMTLTVNKISKKKFMEDPQVTVFNLTRANLLHLGAEFGTMNHGLPCCLRELIINDYQVGLWEFEEAYGKCQGCSRNSTIQELLPYKFNGNGYIIDKVSNKNIHPTEISIQLSFNSFDENSLLFLAYDNNSYMSIHLKGGFPSCEMHYKDTSLEPIIIKSSEQYNYGKTVSLECTKTYNPTAMADIMKFRINNNDVGNISRKKVKRQDILKIKQAPLYFGGVPHDFPIVEFRNDSFLGLMHQVTILPISLSLQNSHFYDVDLYTGKDISLKTALFKPSSYLKLTHPINNFKNATFLLKTKSEKAELVNFETVRYKFKILNGKIGFEDKDGITKSEKTIDDDDFHLITLTHYDNKCKFFIDGSLQGEKKCTFINYSENKDFIINLGGEGFEGAIQDLIINDKILYITSNTYVSSKNVKIGHMAIVDEEKYKKTVKKDDFLMENVTMKDMQQSNDDCSKVNYSLEPNAVKFGDQVNSYVQHNLREIFWKSEFSLEIEFRTFYSNGLIFEATGPKKHYSLLEIRDGYVLMVIKGKKEKKISLNQRVDDGKWHKITLEQKLNRGRRKLLLIVDKEARKFKPPQNRLEGKLFLGNFPQSKSTNINTVSQYRGCMRLLKINNAPQGLINNKNTVHNNIGQCFPTVEMGSYFRGDSYAVYSNSYKLSNFLEVSFRFRTAEQNSVFLSISNFANSPALSLELQNGAVVLSVNMGNSSTTNVTNHLSKSTICDNKWHHVKATFSTELTVDLDGVIQSWVLPNSGFSEQIEAPLYIGGLPDSAPGGTLKIRENFKGCIDNLVIDNNTIDWVQMEELNNVALNSCPVVPP